MRAIPSVLVVTILGLAASVACDDGETASGGGSPDPGIDGGTADSGSGADGSTGAVLAPCPAASAGPGTEHSTEITADETWTAAASPHRVTFGVRTLATLTIEPCATVLVDENYVLTAGSSDKAGAIVARGQKGVDATGAPVRRAVTFAAADPSKPWGGLAVWPTSKLDLESVSITDAASIPSEQNGGGAIVARGEASNGTNIVANVRAVDVIIERARGYGMSFLQLSAFTADSRDVTVKDSGRVDRAFPLRLEPGALATVPAGLVLTGNAANEIEIVAANVGMGSDTIRARGVPYRVTGRLQVAPPADGPASTLTIEPGVTLRFAESGDSGMYLGTSSQRQGLLVAVGTPSAPITFTSAKTPPAPADWKNIYFFHSPDSGNAIENAVVEYAGGPSGAQGYGCGAAENDASVLILSGRPGDAFIKSTTFRNGGGDTGIVLGWTSDLTGPDFKAPNTFTSMPACSVSRWRNATGEACPGSTSGSPVCL